MAIQWADKGEWNAKRHVIAGEDTNGDGIVALPLGMWENDDGPADWWAIVDDYGIFAYTDEEATADELVTYFQKHAIRETIEEHVARP
jgi:hypothetical protein